MRNSTEQSHFFLREKQCFVLSSHSVGFGAAWPDNAARQTELSSHSAADIARQLRAPDDRSLLVFHPDQGSSQSAGMARLGTWHHRPAIHS
jgi:hypothetical protein